MEKKKAGRPKKVVKTAPKEPVKNAAYYEKALANLQKDKDTMQRQYETLLKKAEISRLKYKEAHDDLHKQVEEAEEKRQFWIQKTGEAQKKNEALFNLVKELVDTAVNDLVQVEVTTGKITALDAIYHVSMIERVMEAKFNPETEE
jgi:hypothetical protein